MKRIHAVIVAAMAVILILAGVAWAEDTASEDPGTQAGAQVYVHFIVVPQAAANGQDVDQLLVDFKAELLRLAGGYTELGVTSGGFQPPSGAPIKAPGTSLLVAADSDLAARIKAWGDERFGSPVYVLVWTAQQYF